MVTLNSRLQVIAVGSRAECRWTTARLSTSSPDHGTLALHSGFLPTASVPPFESLCSCLFSFPWILTPPPPKVAWVPQSARRPWKVLLIHFAPWHWPLHWGQLHGLRSSGSTSVIQCLFVELPPSPLQPSEPNTCSCPSQLCFPSVLKVPTSQGYSKHQTRERFSSAEKSRLPVSAQWISSVNILFIVVVRRWGQAPRWGRSRGGLSSLLNLFFFFQFIGF